MDSPNTEQTPAAPTWMPATHQDSAGLLLGKAIGERAKQLPGFVAEHPVALGGAALGAVIGGRWLSKNQARFVDDLTQTSFAPAAARWRAAFDQANPYATSDAINAAWHADYPKVWQTHIQQNLEPLKEQIASHTYKMMPLAALPMGIGAAGGHVIDKYMAPPEGEKVAINWGSISTGFRQAAGVANKGLKAIPGLGALGGAWDAFTGWQAAREKGHGTMRSAVSALGHGAYGAATGAMGLPGMVGGAVAQPLVTNILTAGKPLPPKGIVPNFTPFRNTAY